MLIKFNNSLLIKITFRNNVCWKLCFTKFEDNALLICNKKNLTSLFRLFDTINNKFIDFNKLYNKRILLSKVDLKNEPYSTYCVIELSSNYNLLINNTIYLINKNRHVH